LKRATREEKPMTIDDRISRVKDLIQKREEIDAELAGLFGSAVRGKKAPRCSKRGEEGNTTPRHATRRSCTQSASNKKGGYGAALSMRAWKRMRPAFEP
jgi:hypothetical protein